MKIHSSVVSQVVPVGFADLAQAADFLPGTEVAGDRARLMIHGHAGTGLAGAVRFDATLRTTSLLIPWVKVELVVSPWSAGRSEVAVHPISNLGPLDSMRSNRFYESARSILAPVIDRLSRQLPLEVPVPAELAA
jgi:hypothetical protein